MSEVLAQLKQKGGGSGGDLLAVDFSPLPSNTDVTRTLEYSTPDIKKLVAIVVGAGNLSSVAEFTVENTTITQTNYTGSNWYGSYYQITLNGNQITVNQHFSGSSSSRMRILYLV